MPPSGPSSADQRMFCLQLTFQHFSQGDKIVRAEDVLEYAAKLEEYLRYGYKKPSGLTIAQ